MKPIGESAGAGLTFKKKNCAVHGIMQTAVSERGCTAISSGPILVDNFLTPKMSAPGLKLLVATVLRS